MTLKRSPLVRRTPLRAVPPSRRRALRSVPKPGTPSAAERAWKVPRWGRCESCRQIDVLPLHGHHLIERPVLRRIDPALEWDERGRIDLCERCHFEHHYGLANRKLPMEKIPDEALAFAVDVLGEEQAAFYIRRHYLCGGEAA